MSNSALKFILKQFKEDITPDELYKLLKAESDVILAALTDVKLAVIEQYQEDPDSITSVQVIPTAPRRTTSWAKVAEEANVSKTIISKYTKMGQPGYTIKLKTEEQEKLGDGKFISA